MSSEERFEGKNIIEAGKLSPYWGDHMARYVYSLQFIENKKILDIACGTGYGLSILKPKAKFIIGVDNNFETTIKAKRQNTNDIQFLCGNGPALPFANESFEVITSFETLEHLHEREEFLSELKRILVQNGLLILSTPNANYTNPINDIPSNPYHVIEYTQDRLKFEISKSFTIKTIIGQTLFSGFGISPFYNAQKKLPHDLLTQIKLFSWKILNHMPVRIREKISQILWNRQFYPIEKDYEFKSENVENAPVLIVICQKIV